MLRTNDEGQTYLDVALEAIRDTMKSNVFRCTSKVHGILFLGAKNEKNEHQFRGIHKLHDLQQPGARFIKDIEVLMDEDVTVQSEDEDMDEDLASTQKVSYGKIFKERIGCESESSHLPLHDALWLTALEMSKAKLKSDDIREIQIFTNDDDPFKQDQTKSKQAEDKARAMIQDENYDIFIFCMDRRHDQHFDLKKFYQRIVPDDPDDPHILRAGTGSFRDFIDDIRRKEFKKRANARVPFRVGNPRGDKDGLFEFGVEVFNCVQFITKPSATKLEAKNNKPTQVRTRWICDTSGAVLLPHEIKTYHFYGNRRVYLTKAETQELKQFGIDRHFRLMGFADISSLRPELSLKSPYFVRPDEFNYPGSGKFFTALHRRMTRRAKIAYVSFIPTGASMPRVYAMVPQLETVDDETGNVVNAAGFNLIAMPYKQEIRDVGSEIVQPLNEFDPLRTPSESQKNAAIDMVRKVQLKNFTHSDFENPTLQHHYCAVEALALGNESEWDPKLDDQVHPDMAGMTRHEATLNAFQEAFDDIPESKPKKKATKKRKALSSGDVSSTKKKVKLEITWAEIEKSGKVPKKITVAQLKALCKERGLKATGKKADLVSRVEGQLLL